MLQTTRPASHRSQPVGAASWWRCRRVASFKRLGDLSGSTVTLSGAGRYFRRIAARSAASVASDLTIISYNCCAMSGGSMTSIRGGGGSRAGSVFFLIAVGPV